MYIYIYIIIFQEVYNYIIAYILNGNRMIGSQGGPCRPHHLLLCLQVHGSIQHHPVRQRYPAVLCKWHTVLQYYPAVLCKYQGVLQYYPAVLCKYRTVLQYYLRCTL